MSWFQRKIKMVAARASDALAQAADIVAPTLYESRVDEFHHRWTTVSRFLDSVLTRDLDPQEQRRLLLESHTRDSLQKLVLLIYAEENDTDKAELTRQHVDADNSAQTQTQGTDGQQAPRACLEYLLERQLIPHLCDVGRRDAPCGIMSLAMQFVSALLSRVDHPILPTREVHVSVVALLQAATKKEVDDVIVRKCLITLLNVLWKKLRCDPVQTEFFFLHADRRSGSDMEISDLVLFTGLLPHMYAAQKTGEKCREALVIAASVHEPALCRFILTLTPFCHYAVNGVISAFDALPKTLPDQLVRSNGNAATGSDTSGGPELDTQLHSLAMRLRFCCTLAMVGQYELTDATSGTRKSISNEILTQLQTRFLDGPLLDGLMHTSEATARTATLYARIILEELAACCRDTNANPLLMVFLRFLVEQEPHTTTETPPAVENQRRLPLELMHRMDSLSSSLSIATMDLFTSLLDLQNDFVDQTLLGSRAAIPVNSPKAAALQRRSSLASALSPRAAAQQNDSAIWLASRFPESAVAANAHIWKIQGFDSMASHVEIPVSSFNDGEASEDQIVSLLSYIADAEYATCQRAPAVLDDYWDSDDEDFGAVSDATPTDMASETPVTTVSSPDATKRSRRDSEGLNSSSSARTAATRNSMKPLKEVPLTLSIASYSPVVSTLSRPSSPAPAQRPNDDSAATVLTAFERLVLNRLERVLESSFYENLALSGLISALAQKNQCASVVFDVAEALGSGGSIRSVLEEVHADAVRRTSRLANGHARLAEIRRKLVEENNEASLNDHEPETRLLCGFVVLEEILKELCSLLFAKERVKNLPVKPEGYYLEPKRLSLSQPLAESPSGSRDTANGGAVLNIGQEFEQLMADAESTMGSILTSTSVDTRVASSASQGHSEDTADLRDVSD